MILRAEQASRVPALVSFLVRVAGWSQPWRLCSHREAVQLLWGLGQGRLAGMLVTSCFFTDEVGEWKVRESSSSSLPGNRLLGPFLVGLC